MSVKPYTTVRLLTDRYQDKGVSAGDAGTILEVYDDEAYEVEFFRPDGTTITWFAVAQDEVAMHEPILLASDVQPFFPDSDTVNEALRLLIQLAQQPQLQHNLLETELLQKIAQSS